jgi:hypothetical protein
MKKWFKNIVILFFVFALLCDFAFAQQAPAKPDSAKVYRDIETFSKKRKSTKFLYRIFFKPVAIPKAVQSKVAKKKTNQPKPYSAYEGKIIREIYITTLDPFGHSVTDTTTAEQNFLSNAGNTMHFKTLRITIQNLLLIHKDEPFDSLLVKESERLIRSQRYVHEVAFKVESAGKKSDCVDIYIRELDKWSFIPAGAISTSNFRLAITEKNFFGSGHEFKNDFNRNYIDGVNTFNTDYSIPNIRNTYVSSALHYGTDGYKNYSRSITVDRPFFSPFAKWAAGISLSSQYRNDSLKTAELVNVPYTLKYGTQDFWAGKSQRIFGGSSEAARVTNFIMTARYLRVRFHEAPPAIYDTAHNYSNEDFYLAGIGISTRKYFQDSYVFNYGIIEDVPVGAVYALTGGYQVKNNTSRMYFGLRYSFGNYTNYGYLSYDLEYGNFYRSSHAEQGVFTAAVNYFTGLIEIGNWKFRQFIKPQLTLGLNRFPTERLTINNENGIRGFSSSDFGTKKIILTLQTQAYAPWNILGFRFGPYLVYSLGMLASEPHGFNKSQVFSQFGFGLLIKNDFLVLNFFQVSVAFYPNIPGSGTNVFKYNSISSTDFGFRDFVIGKPAPVAYQ